MGTRGVMQAGNQSRAVLDRPAPGSLVTMRALCLLLVLWGGVDAQNLSATMFPLALIGRNQPPRPECRDRQVVSDRKQVGLCRARTECGEVAGLRTRTSRANKFYCRYTSIRYAAPPLRGLRFKAPRPFTCRGPTNATQPHPVCIGLGPVNNDPARSSEDCLFLTIFAPEDCGDGPLAVIVWFHWGGFFLGGGDLEYTAADNMLDQCVIVVVVQYRLGPLGFLLTTCEDSNAGLKDQVMALRWVQRNIEFFGGDRDRVTIYGQSAGGASVGYHLISCLSKGLFTRAIMISGSPLHSFGYTTPSMARQHARNLAVSVGCPTGNAQALVRCLRSKPAKALVDNQLNSATVEDVLTLRLIIFIPTSCDSCRSNCSCRPGQQDITRVPFICQDPFPAFEKGFFNTKAVLIGGNSNEGALLEPIVTRLDVLGVITLPFNLNPVLLLPSRLRGPLSTNNSGEISRRLTDFYDVRLFTRLTLYRLIRIFTQAQFTLPLQQAAYYIAGCGDVTVYNYHFKFVTEYEEILKTKQGRCACGVSHGDELPLVWHYQFLDDADCNYRESFNRSAPGQEFMDLFSQMYARFAQTGEADWQAFTAQQPFYLNIDRPSPGVDLVVDACDLQLWNNIAELAIGDPSYFSPTFSGRNCSQCQQSSAKVPGAVSPEIRRQCNATKSQLLENCCGGLLPSIVEPLIDLTSYCRRCSGS